MFFIHVSGGVSRLINKVEVVLSDMLLLGKVFVSIIAPDVMIVPYSDNLSVFAELFVVGVFLGLFEALLYVVQVHRIIRDPLGLRNIIRVCRISKPGPEVRSVSTSDHSEDVISEIQDPIARTEGEGKGT